MKQVRNVDGTFAGAGTTWAFYEDEETWEDNKVDVKLTYDFLTKEERAELNGPVKTYFIKEDKQ
mgnify:FL=1